MNGIRISSLRIGIMIFGIIIAISVLGLVLYLNRAGEVSSVGDDARDITLADKEIPNTSHIQVSSSSDDSETQIDVIAEVPEQEMATEATLTRRNADRKAGEDVTSQNNPSYLDDLLPVMEDFKANPGFRESSARKLLPHLTKGMAVDAVAELLGEPTDKDDHVWRYSVFYSKLIEVYFDEKGIVTKIMPVGIEDDQLERSHE